MDRLEENDNSRRGETEPLQQRRPEVEAWLTSIITIHQDAPAPRDKQTNKPKIQKVPPMLRNIVANRKCYEPLVVSLGPFYHGRPELEPMEKLKTEMSRLFVADNMKHIKELYAAVAAVAGEARKCYDAGATDAFDEVDFSKMMFLDGCFIIQFMRMITVEKGLQIGNVMKSNDVAFAYRDLFLLENQVPFLVLEALMPEIEAMMTKFFQDTSALPPETIRYLPTIIKFMGAKVGQPGSTAGDNLHPKSIHLLDFYRSQLVNGNKQDAGNDKQTRSWSSYRSAKELKTVGIHFLPSRTQSYKDVSFQSNLLTGTLRLPPLTVDDSTKSKLLNMVAYETCPDAPDDFSVTSYICLMDDLIDQAEDVVELRSKGVLLNLLGSDQQVADLFNEIGNDLVPNPTAYSEVRGQIEGHYKNRLNVWIAQFCHTHFSSPWTIFGLFAAIFVIALAFTQTYFTVFPRKSDAAPPSASPH